ncbi:hypothetical protein evm_005458 [Chilo suppressalis]|nr:hypothetical protein evm_005458 [Chilo suppressalis]
MSVNEAYTDVVELCALLQCLGFSVKSLDTSDTNLSQDGGTRTVVINCQSSGLHVVLESPGLSCSCPATDQNSGVWQVSGITGGKQLDKEFGCTLLGSLPKSHRERLNRELREMIRCIKQHNESVENENNKAKENNKSASMVELNTPEKRLFQPKVDTPTRYRSLDTLTTAKDAAEPQLPEPRPLAKQLIGYTEEEMNDHKIMCRRQSTYTLSSTPGSVRRRNKTSSPIQNQQSTLLESLIEAEKVAENLRNKLAFVIKEYVEEGKCDSSMSSLALDMSRISVLKGEPGKQFASSPNLSGLGKAQNDFTKSRIKRFDSASTSNLLAKKPPPNEKPSKLRRLSPNIFNKAKKDGVKSDKNPPKIPDNKSSKIGSLFRPKIVTPVSRPPESSPNLSTAKRKFNHIKSTIPRPTPVKKE